MCVLLVTGCLPYPASDAPWLLVAPPYVYEDGAVRMDDDAPLSFWQCLAEFDDGAACQQCRDGELHHAADDEQWALWSKSQCVGRPRHAVHCRPNRDNHTTLPHN